jgi:multidrug efflux pump subunit AcrA (membrane-fusion protein)
MSVDNNAGPDTRPIPRKQGMRIVSSAAFLLLVLLCGLTWFWFSDRLPGATAQPSPPASPPQVTVAKPVVKNIVEWDDFTGRFEATDDVSIRSRVTG